MAEWGHCCTPTVDRSSRPINPPTTYTSYFASALIFAGGAEVLPIGGYTGNPIARAAGHGRPPR